VHYFLSLMTVTTPHVASVPISIIQIQYISLFTRHSLVEVFVLLYVCLFVNDFSTTRGPIHAKVSMRAYSGSGCVFSPFGGWRPPAGGKRGQ